MDELENLSEYNISAAKIRVRVDDQKWSVEDAVRAPYERAQRILQEAILRLFKT